MDKRLKRAFAGIAAGALAVTLAGCSGGTSDAPVSIDPDTPVELTLGGWGGEPVSNFQMLADAFSEEHPNVTVSLKEYSATDYDTQLTADMSAGAAPDVFALKAFNSYYFYATNGQLLDVSDVAQTFDGDEDVDLGDVVIDDTAYAMPYRQDKWVLYYNKALLEQAGVAAPDGSWTWDDFVENSKTVTEKVGGDVKGTYLHTWNNVVQGPAMAQTDGATDQYLAGDFSYLKPYYERDLELQDAGATIDYSTAQSQTLNYWSLFGSQKVALLPMGSFYTSMLVADQASGTAEDFEWGIAPMPAADKDSVGDDITNGGPTVFAANANIDPKKEAAAKAFLEFATGPEGALVTIESGYVPAYHSSDVVDAYFDRDGMPTDDLSKSTMETSKANLEAPLGETTADIQTILKDLDSAIRTGSMSIDDAIAEAESTVKNDGLAK
ncbi:ABC transporter substrate-binding protein [Propionimicrobium sp. PCR01-08-3]|uniref:ABC transporter substrate-binding protein n=1 Tax=Propionimicrobium sp. PCR01-08-3 TaxID=3052086 RepID=UPI00255C50FF|nr:ABC transporter substrate-binding protein [Propionimicrobium sp. PCR01-08-3]WIY81710.1 ABC transporter substrate-binding protein [Propionimicrobium sp. PCR01-08-3]